MPDEMGLAPMLALILVRLARPIAIGSRLCCRWVMLAGMIIRPAATSSRTCSAVRCGSRAATDIICGVIVPTRACSNCVIGSNSTGWQTDRRLPSAWS